MPVAGLLPTLPDLQTSPHTHTCACTHTCNLTLHYGATDSVIVYKSFIVPLLENCWISSALGNNGVLRVLTHPLPLHRHPVRLRSSVRGFRGHGLSTCGLSTHRPNYPNCQRDHDHGPGERYPNFSVSSPTLPTHLPSTVKTSHYFPSARPPPQSLAPVEPS